MKTMVKSIFHFLNDDSRKLGFKARFYSTLREKIDGNVEKKANQTCALFFFCSPSLNDLSRKLVAGGMPLQGEGCVISTYD